MNKKKITGLFFGFLVICGMLVVIFNTIPNNNEINNHDESIKVITSSYSGVSYDLFYSSNFSGSVILFAGGILGHKQYSSGWASILAEEGYGVLTFSTPPEDLENVPRYVENCKNNIETLIPFVLNTSIFPIPIDEESIALIGMSGGGAAALSLNDTRIKTSIAICPYYIDNSSADNASPVLIITGSDDYIAPSESHGLEYYEELNPNKMIIEQDDVGHDMSPVGWEHLVAWLDYYVNNDHSVFPELTDTENHPEISFSKSDFSTLSSDIV